jgi:hypothetical protein
MPELGTTDSYTISFIGRIATIWLLANIIIREAQRLNILNFLISYIN